MQLLSLPYYYGKFQICFFETVIVIVISTLNTTHVSSIRFTLFNVKYVKKSHIFIASHYFSDIIVVEWRSIICYVNLP